MAKYQVAWNTTTRIATVQFAGDALPVGSTKIGEFDHTATTEEGNDIENYEFGPNHVLWHHVRDALYKQGVQDMQRVRIDLDSDFVAVVSFTAVPATIGRTVGQTQQITHVWTPTNASNKKVTYVSSNPAVATVNASGLITAVAAGTATITSTAEDGGSSHTTVVTVT